MDTPEDEARSRDAHARRAERLARRHKGATGA
jgi:hypothetical protein